MKKENAILREAEETAAHADAIEAEMHRICIENGSRYIEANNDTYASALKELEEAGKEHVFVLTEDQLIDFCTKTAVRLVECGTLSMPPKDKLSQDMDFEEALREYGNDVRLYNVMMSRVCRVWLENKPRPTSNDLTVKQAYEIALQIKWRTVNMCGGITLRKMTAFFEKFGLDIHP